MRKYIVILSLLVVITLLFSFGSMLHIAGAIDAEQVVDLERVDEAIDFVSGIRIVIP